MSFFKSIVKPFSSSDLKTADLRASAESFLAHASSTLSREDSIKLAKLLSQSNRNKPIDLENIHWMDSVKSKLDPSSPFGRLVHQSIQKYKYVEFLDKMIGSQFSLEKKLDIASMSVAFLGLTSEWDEKKDIFNLILTIPEFERKEIMKLSQPFIEGENKRIKKKILNFLKNIPYEERQSLIQYASPLLINISEWKHKAAILDALRSISPQERKNVIVHFQSILTVFQDKTLDPSKHIGVLLAISEIPHAKRSQIIKQVEEQSKKNGYSLDDKMIIHLIHKTVLDTLQKQPYSTRSISRLLACTGRSERMSTDAFNVHIRDTNSSFNPRDKWKSAAKKIIAHGIGKDLESIEQLGCKGASLSTDYWQEVFSDSHFGPSFMVEFVQFWKNSTTMLSFNEWANTQEGQEEKERILRQRSLSVNNLQVEYLSDEERDQFKVYLENTSNGIVVKDANHSLKAPGQYAFVMGPDKQMYAGEHKTDQFHHSSFLRGKPVICAGKISIGIDGRVINITNKSGHYKPDSRHMYDMLKLLQADGLDCTGIHLKIHGSSEKQHNVSDFLKYY